MVNKNFTTLCWGGGSIDCFLDLRSRELFEASSAAGFGGKVFYTSRSGLSGAVSIPASPALREVGTYRVDTVHVECPSLQYISEALPGLKILAPIDYQGGGIDRQWPIIAVLKDRIHLVDECGLADLLVGKEEELVDREITIRYFPSPKEEVNERVFKIRVQRRRNFNFRRVIVGMFSSELAFNAGEEEDDNWREDGGPAKFYRRLGIRQIGGLFYKVAQRVCWARYTAQDLSTVEGLQAAAPANALVLTPTLYIQESEVGTFSIIGLRQVDSGETEVVERTISATEAVRAMSGDFSGIADATDGRPTVRRRRGGRDGRPTVRRRRGGRSLPRGESAEK